MWSRRAAHWPRARGFAGYEGGPAALLPLSPQPAFPPYSPFPAKESVVIDGSAVLGVFSVYIAGVVIPGPNFVAVAHKAASATRVEALAVVAGIVLVNLFWASCAILGVGIVFAAFPWLALAVRVGGAAYLIWFGGRLIVNASAGKPVTSVNAPAGGFRQSFAQGFAT